MSKAIVTIATGTYKELLALSGPSLQRYANRIGAKFIAITDRKFHAWQLEKFRAKEVCEQHDRTCFIDCDVMIRNDAENLFEVVPEQAIGMHDDYPYLAERKRTDWIQPARDAVLESQGESGSYHTVLNTGVIVASRQHADIWNPLREPFPKHHCAEQFWIEHQAYRNGYSIKQLDSDFNWQWWFRWFKKREPQFRHYANCPHRNRIAFMRRDRELCYAH